MHCCNRLIRPWIGSGLSPGSAAFLFLVSFFGCFLFMLWHVNFFLSSYSFLLLLLFLFCTSTCWGHYVHVSPNHLQSSLSFSLLGLITTFERPLLLQRFDHHFFDGQHGCISVGQCDIVIVARVFIISSDGQVGVFLLLFTAIL